MAEKILQSTPITFIDQTDSRKLEVYIKSNLPTVQIQNSNTGAHTPDWREGENLKLEADVFLDSRIVEEAYSNTYFIKWYKDEISDNTEITANKNKKTLQIATNELDSNPIITYICEATYQGIVASMRLTFARVDTGLNGDDGADGTSVKIKGTASSVAQVSGTDYYTITYSGSDVSSAELNDAYMYSGDLYVCVESRVGTDYFINVGRIQGPVGEPAKNIILSGSAQVFKVSETGTYTPSTISVTAHTFNTSITSWTYSVNGGQTFSSTAPTGVSRSGNIVTVTGSTLASNSIVVKASDGAIDDVFTIYKAFDGTDGSDGDKGDPAPLAFLTNENISFAANENGQVSLTTFTTNVVAYKGTTKVAPTVRTKADGTPDITDLPAGMTASAPINSSNEQILTFSIANNATLGSPSSNSGTITIPITSPVSTNLKLNWSKINTGATGVGVSSTTVSYGVSDSASTKPADNAWQSTIPVVGDGKYLWTRTIIDYTDANKPDTVTYTYAKQGEKGNTGNPGTPVTVSSIQYQEGTSATTAPTGTWSNAVVAVADGRYLWTKTTFSDGEYAYGVAKQGSSGTPASLVDITPSAMYFKSTTGSTGTFEPQYIYLYPRFQNAIYSNWQYSRDGGTTWTSASGASGLTIGTYNSVANSLRIDRSSTLYTNTITSISFRCNSNNATVYDTVSIAKIYDVADLQIGGRNYLLNSANEQFTPGTSRAEFLKTTFDLAPFFDERGLIEVTLSFDGYSPIAGDIQVYLQNGSNSKYSFIKTVPFTTEWARYSVTVTPTLVDANVKEAYLSFYGIYDTGKIPHVRNLKLEIGNTATDYTPAPEDLIEEAANVNVMLSNEAHFFEATAGGVPIDTSVTLDVVGYKGSVKSATTVGTISGIPSAGMTATVTNNGTANTKLTIAITSALTSDIADYGILTIPITVNGHTINKIFNWTKAKAGDVGASGSDAVTFQVYSNNGYALSTSVPTLTLQTFAYVGDVEIKAGATYQWYRHNNTSWVAISGATNDYFNVSRDDVTFSNNYMCKMLFSGAEYVGVVTIEDKNDENKVFASKPSNYFAGDLWIVGTDYTPSGYTVGTMLRAEHTNTTYADGDWVPATKYDDEIKELKDAVDSYKQYFSVNSANGLQIGNSSINNNVLTIDRVEATTVNADAANIEALNVVGRYSGSTMLQAPIINLGNFSIVIESNGSLSIVANV